MSKKKLLFVNESLALAGGEKSLIALLTNLDPEIYDIDLQLFRYGGDLDGLIPKYVNVLQPIPFTVYSRESLKTNLKTLQKKRHLDFLKSKLLYSLNLRIGNPNHPKKAELYWEASKNSICANPKKYDVAIAYAQGVPTFYVKDKITATKKITWLNARPNFEGNNIPYQKKYYRNYDAIVPVSNITQQQFIKVFPQLQSRIHTIQDIVDYKSIIKMSKLEVVKFKPEVFNILTVARLSLGSKRYDIVIEACRILKERGLLFHWYAMGQGPYREQMEKYIMDYKLQDHFSFLGIKNNPYPFYKAADLYVQTSEYESFGISIAEARLLNIPVVTTRFDTVFMQMVDGKNGLVTDLNAEAVANAIERIMRDQELYNSIVEYLKKEMKENYESVKIFDTLIERMLDTKKSISQKSI